MRAPSTLAGAALAGALLASPAVASAHAGHAMRHKHFARGGLEAPEPELCTLVVQEEVVVTAYVQGSNTWYETGVPSSVGSTVIQPTYETQEPRFVTKTAWVDEVQNNAHYGYGGNHQENRPRPGENDETTQPPPPPPPATTQAPPPASTGGGNTEGQGPAPAPPAGGNKRGALIDYNEGFDGLDVLRGAVSWAATWKPSNILAQGNPLDILGNVKFAPHMRGRETIDGFDETVAAMSNVLMIMGPNEPERPEGEGGSAMSAGEVADLWRKHFQNSKYPTVAPAVSSERSKGDPWWSAFNAACADCDWTYMATHYYLKCDGSESQTLVWKQFEDYLNHMYTVGGNKNIVVGEWGCGDGTSDGAMVSFITGKLDTCDKVAYHAYNRVQGSDAASFAA